MSATGSRFDPTTDQGLVDLLGALAYASLTAFGRTAADAELAPRLAMRAALSRLAVAGYRNYEVLVGELSALGVEPEDAMAPFVPPIDAFHTRTRSSDGLEGLLGAYVMAGLGTDFAAEVLALDGPQRERLVAAASQLVREPGAEFAADAIRAAVVADPAVSGRLALWSRRLLGEALSQAQRVAADRVELTSLLGGGLSEFGAMLVRLSDRHAARVRALGLG